MHQRFSRILCLSFFQSLLNVRRAIQNVRNYDEPFSNYIEYRIITYQHTVQTGAVLRFKINDFASSRQRVQGQDRVCDSVILQVRCFR